MTGRGDICVQETPLLAMVWLLDNLKSPPFLQPSLSKRVWQPCSLHTPILSHSLQGKKVPDISATQLLDLDTRTTEILSFKKINRRVFELDRFKDFPL